jgi:hypothetical protein
MINLFVNVDRCLLGETYFIKNVLFEFDPNPIMTWHNKLHTNNLPPTQIIKEKNLY